MRIEVVGTGKSAWQEQQVGIAKVTLFKEHIGLNGNTMG